MKKYLFTFNKALALLLALVLMIPTGVMSFIITVTASSNTVTVTDGELVANNYDSLTDGEKALQKSGLIAGSSYTFTTPGNDDGLIAVDTDNKKVTVSDYTDGEYTWRPASAKLVYADGEESIELDDEGKGSFSYDGNVYSVEVEYELLIPVDAAVQSKLLNGPYLISKSVGNMNAVLGEINTFDSLGSNIGALVKLTDGSIKVGQATIRITDENVVNAIKRLNDQTKNNEFGDLDIMDFLYDYDSASSKSAYLFSNGAGFRDTFKATYADIDVICGLTYIDNLIDVVSSQSSSTANKMKIAVNALRTLLRETKPAYEDGWAILEAANNPLKSGMTAEDYEELDGYVNAIKNANYHNDAIKEELTAGRVTVCYNVNQYNVEVTLAANVIDSTTVDSTETTALETRTTTIQVLAGATADEVREAVANSGIEAIALAAWIDIDEENYVRSESDLPGTVDENIEYVITYSPKNVNVTYGFETTLPTSVPYGYNMTLPLHGGDELVYDYEINGKRYLEGEVYRADGDFTVNRSEGKPWDALRLAQIVADVYSEDLMEGETEALSSAALKSDTVLLRKPTNDDGLLTVTALGGEDFEVTASEYPSGIEGIFWTPSTGKAVNGTETVAEFTFTGGKAEFSAAEFERVEVEYGMTLTNISDEEIINVLNLPGILAAEADDQIDNLEYLNGAYDELGKLDQKTLNQIQVGVKGSEMGDEAKAAAQAIIDGCVDKENASLYIYQYLTQYRSTGLTYYYQNANYAKMRNQIGILIDNFSAIYNDPKFLPLLEDIGYESYYDQIGDLLDDLGGIVLTDPNAAIDTTSPSLSELVAALVKIGDDSREFDAASKKLTLGTTLTEAAPERSVLTVKVILKNSAGDEISNKYDTLTFSAVEALTDDDIDSINSLIGNLVDDLKIDVVHYATADTLGISAGDTLVKNETLAFTYTPKQYTVIFNDVGGEKVGEETFFFDVATVTLPGCHLEGKQYRYTVCGETVITGTEDKSASFTTEQIDNGEYGVITRETLDVEREYTLALINDLNEGMFNVGMLSAGKLTMAFIPMEDEDGNITLVFRVNTDNGDMIKDAFQSIAETITGSSFTHIKLGDELLRDDSVISVQAITDALLNSGISFDTIQNAITPDGDIIEMDPIPGVTVIGAQIDPETGEQYIKVKSGRINDTDVLGAYLTDFDMTFGFSANDEGKKVKLYLTLEDFDENTDSLKDLRSTADKVKERGNVTLHDGIADIEITLTEELHQLYMLAMAALGNADLSDLTEVDLVPAIDLFVDILEYMVSDESITLDTLENTGKKANIDLDLSELRGHYDDLRYLFKGAIHNIKALNEESVDGTYSADLHYDLSSLLDDFGLSDSLRGIIKESRTGLDAKIKLKVNNSCDYQAIIIDTGADGTNMIKFTRDVASEALAIRNDAVIILLDDVAADITLNMETVVLDLNGHTITGDLNCRRPAIVIDSSIATDSGAGVDGNVTGKVTITAGRYTSDVSALLKGGYMQDDTGLVRNGFFFIEDDGEGGTDVHITPEIDTVNATDDDSIRDIAMEIATDIFLNNYSRAAMKIGGNGIYSFKVDDAFALLDHFGSGDLNDLLSGIDCPGITAFINDLLAKLFDFESLGQAIQNGTPVGTYALEYEPWIFEFDHVTDGDYLTVNLLANDENVKSKNVSIYVDDNLGFGKTVSEMGKVVTTTPEFELTEVKYVNGKLDVKSKLSFDVTVDTRDYPDYAIATAVALADATSDADKRAALVEGIKKYYYNGRMAKLKEASANFTTEELFAALYTAKSFPKMLAELGLTGVVDSSVTELFNSYKSALKAIRAVDEHLADFEGSDKTLASLETENYGEYYAESTNRIESIDYAANSQIGASIRVDIEKVALTVKVFNEEPSYFIIVTDERGNELYTGDDINEAFAATKSGATVSVVESVPMTEDITVGVDVMVFGSDRISYGEYSMILSGEDAELTTDTEITDKVKSSSEYSEVTVTGTYVYKLKPLDPEIKAPVPIEGEALKGATIDTVNKRIIIDVLDPESYSDKMRAGYGVTAGSFGTVVGFEILNAETVEMKFTAKGKELASGALVPNGTELTVTATNPDSDVTATATYTVIIIGDVNCNGSVDSGDALQMMSYYFGRLSLSEIQLIAADVNCNGDIDSGDALKNMVKYNRPRNYKSNVK